MNNQPRSKKDHGFCGDIFIHHGFLTFQGEGPFAGYPAIFLRLYGCNLQCPLCDTDYTSEMTRYAPVEVLSLVNAIRGDTRADLVVLTGGEPMRQNIGPVVSVLAEAGYTVQVETNGTLCPDDFPFHQATIVCSPKTGRLNERIGQHAAAFKYVIKYGDFDITDGLPLTALDHPTKNKVARPPRGYKGPIYIQPADEGDSKANEDNLQAAVWSSLTFGHILCVQVHKYIGVE